DGLGFGRLAFQLVPADLRADRFVEDLLADLKAGRLEPSSISLRLTSAALIARGTERILPMLRRLHDLGVELVLAEFGAGETSLSLLQELP
ncbi:EAL domain-containing protein, partial [Mycobacterium tuberculosis]|nr:EAL domain-containing protein [Mycobacterium tuberculosis]